MKGERRGWGAGTRLCRPLCGSGGECRSEGGQTIGCRGKDVTALGKRVWQFTEQQDGDYLQKRMNRA